MGVKFSRGLGDEELGCEFFDGGVLFAEIFNEGFPVVLGDLLNGAVDDCCFGEDVEIFVAFELPELLFEVGLVLAKRRSDSSEVECPLPLIERNTLILRKTRFVFRDPDFIDRTLDDLHELLLVDEADKSRDQQSDNDTRDRRTQILKMVEKRFFGVWVHLVPQLEHFLKNKHPAGF